MPATVDSTKRRWLWPAIDLTIWTFAVVSSVALRFDFDLGRVDAGALVLMAMVWVVHLTAGLTVGPYAIGHVHGSLEEVVDITRTVVPASAVAFVVNWFTSPLWVPRSVPITAALIAVVMMFGARFVVRMRSTRATTGADAQHRVIVYGAGDGGRQLIRSLVADPDSRLAPVAILDDDAAKRRWRIDGIKVRGGRERLAEIAEKTQATMLAVAIPSATSALLRELRELAEANNMEVRVLPAPAISLVRWAPRTCAVSISPISSDAGKSSWTQRRSPRRSAARSFLSLERAGPSVRSCAARSTVSTLSAW